MVARYTNNKKPIEFTMVISYSFFANNSIGELVQEGIEGFIFKDSTSLTELFLVTSKNRKQSARF